MAETKLSKDAIKFIIQCRDDTSEVNTWKKIANKIKQKFDISITPQAVGSSYRQYKGKLEVNSNSLPVAPPVHRELPKVTSSEQPIPSISKPTIDPSVGDRNKTKPQPQLSSIAIVKSNPFEPTIKRNMPLIDDELLGIET